MHNFYLSKKNGFQSSRRCAGARKRAHADIAAQACAARHLWLSSIDLRRGSPHDAPCARSSMFGFTHPSSRCSGAATDIAAPISLWPIVARCDPQDTANDVAKGLVVIHPADAPDVVDA